MRGTSIYSSVSMTVAATNLLQDLSVSLNIKKCDKPPRNSVSEHNCRTQTQVKCSRSLHFMHVPGVQDSSSCLYIWSGIAKLRASANWNYFIIYESVVILLLCSACWHCFGQGRAWPSSKSERRRWQVLCFDLLYIALMFWGAKLGMQTSCLNQISKRLSRSWCLWLA